ncbi:MFS general substrate transporter-13 [Coleophoma cylindrospora]|uniref:MFS general substrate transporter-13 n=1 Tax=Coleophoma cylindrospora TaxID=1849047 RepID=A0A3D8QNI4_9HELO|nr:MFS general substrate transporter-13 [Coleophoma cylindrospora]
MASIEEKEEEQLSIHEPDTALEEWNGLEIPDPIIEKKLVRKFDLIILPLLSVIYFTHSLDRANLGNAKTDGFEKDIGLGANQYSLILILFYIPYGTLNIPATVLAKRFSPAVVIPLLMICWGAISLASSAVHNFGGVVAARMLLGVVEAGFFPSAIYYLTMFYTRHEIAKRISIFYMMGFVANAFSGLIAYSVFQWKKSLWNWQYLFIIEGSLTMFLAIVCFILLPRNVAASKYFNESEKHCATVRLQRESEIETIKFSWSATLKPLLDWHTWMFGFMALCYGVASASISNFLPTIIKRLTVDTVKANLYTIAPNLNGAIWIIVMCYISDRFQIRSFCSMFAVGVSMIGFICLGTVDVAHHFGIGYFFTFLLTFGGFTPAVLIPAWASSNIPSNSARATTLGLLAGMQNIAGIISSEAFRTQDAPVYAPALIISGCFQGAMVLTAAFAFFYYRRINKQLDSGERVSVAGMEQNLNFRYIL